MGYALILLTYQKIDGKQIKYIKIPYTPEGMLKMDNPVSGFMIRLPIVIPTVPFCIADSIATVKDCLLFILNQFELLYPIKSMEKINSIIAGPN